MRKSVPIFGLILLMSLVMTCDLFKVGLGDEVDIKPPEFGVESHDNGDYVRGKITIRGTGSDDIGVKSVTLTISKEESPGVYTVQHTATQTELKNGEWAFPIDTTKFDDGEKSITLRITDTAPQPKSQEKKLLLNFDNSPPTVLVTAPEKFGTEDSLYDYDFTIKGDAADVFRVKTVRVRIYKVSEDKVEQVNGGKTPDGKFRDLAEGTVSWKYSYTFDPDTFDSDSDGNYYIVVTAEDFAGNSNSYFYHTKDLSSIEAPSDEPSERSIVITVEDLDNLDRTRSNQDSLSRIRFDGSGNRRMMFKVCGNTDLPRVQFHNLNTIDSSKNDLTFNREIKGTFSDDDGVASAEIRIDDGEWAPLSISFGLKETEWKYNIDDYPGDSKVTEGDHTIEIRVFDVNVNPVSNVESVVFGINEKGPDVTVELDPALEDGLLYYREPFEIVGTATDITGVARIEIFDNNTGESLKLVTFDPAVPEETIEYLVPVGMAGLTDAYKEYRIVATDGYGKTADKLVNFRVDAVPPTVTFLVPEHDPEKDPEIVNGIIAIRGTADDNVQVKEVQLAVEPEEEAPDEETVWIKVNGTNNWTYNLDTTAPGFSDGPYTLYARAIDSAGNTTDPTDASAACKVVFDQSYDLPRIILSNLSQSIKFDIMTTPVETIIDTIGNEGRNSFSGGASIIGIVEDDDMVDAASIMINVNGKGFRAVSNAGANSKSVSWSHVLKDPDNPETPLPDGLHSVRFRASDLASEKNGLPSAQSEVPDPSGNPIVILVDSFPPEIDVAAPETGSHHTYNYNEGERLTIRGTAKDGIGVSAVTLYFNGTTAEATLETPTQKDGQSNYEWRYDMPQAVYAALPEGPVTIKVQAKDGTQKTAEQTIQIYKDSQAPSVSITTGTGTYNGLLKIGGSAEDKLAGKTAVVDKIWLIHGENEPTGSVDPEAPGNWIPLEGAFTWEYELDTVEIHGEETPMQYWVAVVSQDKAGNLSAMGKLSFIIDQRSDRPVVSLTSIGVGEAHDTLEEAKANLLVTGGAISGTITDDDGVGSAEIDLYDRTGNRVAGYPKALTLSGTAKAKEFTYAIAGLSDGAYRVEITAKDTNVPAKTNLALGAVWFACDTALPEVSLSGTAADGQPIGAYRNAAFTIQGTVRDANGIEKVEVSLDDGNTWSELSGVTAEPGELKSWTHGVTVTGNNGSKTIRIRATDRFGRNNLSAPHTVVLDDEKPATPDITSSPGSYVTDSLTIGGETGDATSGVKTVRYRLNGSAGDPATGTLTGTDDWFGTLNTGALSEGTHRVYVWAEDRAGNLSEEASQSFLIDRNPPAIDSVNIAEGAVFNQDITVRVAAHDANGVNEVRVNGQPAVFDEPDDEWRITIEIASIPEGDLTLTVTAKDGAGRSTSMPMTVTVDTTAPEASYTNLDSGGATVLSDAAPRAFGTFSDASGVDKWTYRLERGTLSGGSWNYEVVQPFAAFDAAEDVADNGRTPAWSIDLPAEQGRYRLTLRAWDVAGPGAPNDLAASESREFYIDREAPVANIDSPAAGIRSTDFGPISGQASDPTLDRVEVSVSGLGTETTDALETTQPWSYAGWNWAARPDGQYTVSATAWDGAGRSTQVSRVFTKDTTAPEVSYTNLSPEDGAPLKVFREVNPKITGTITDVNGVISYRVVLERYGYESGQWEAEPVIDQTIPAGGLSSVSLGIELAAQPDGRYRVTITPSDVAAPTANSAAAEPVEFLIDRTAPVISGLNLLEAGSFRSANFPLTFSASDSHWLESVRVKQDGEVIYEQPLSGTSQNVEVTVEVDEGLSEGVHTYEITLTDVSGEDTVLSRSVTIDRNPPTVEITAPSATQTGINALFGDAYTFRGTASDAGAGVAKVYYLISASETAPEGTGGYIEIATSGNWSFSMPLDKDAGAAGDGELDEGRWYLHVKAEDRSGSVTPSAATVEFDVDQAAPSLSETAIGLATVNRNLGFGLGGAIGDTHGIVSVQVWQSKNGEAEIEIDDVGPISNLTTSWSQPNLPRDPADIGTQVTGAAADGQYLYRIVVTDVVGKSTELVRTVRFDATPPELTVSSPTVNEIVGVAPYTVRGTVSDGEGSGLSRLEYAWDAAFADAVQIPNPGVNWIVALDAEALGAEGEKTLYVRAVDKLGQETVFDADPVAEGVQPIRFFYDTAAPELVEGGDDYPQGIGSDQQQTRNDNFSLAGTVSDGYRLEHLRLTATRNGVSQGMLDEWTESGEYSYPVTAAGNDGLWVYTLTATDGAGRTTTQTRTVLIDTTAPTAAITNPGMYLSGNLATIVGTAADGAGNVSGVDKIEYSTDFTDDGDDDNDTWYDATGKINWSVQLDLDVDGSGPDEGKAEGNYYLHVRATDAAGNVTDVETIMASRLEFSIDQANPFVTMLKHYPIGHPESAEDFPELTLYRTSDIVISGTAIDTNGVASVSVTQSKSTGSTDALVPAVNGAAGDTERTWSVTTDFSQGEGTYTYTITATDVVGRPYAVTRTVVVDTQSPNPPVVTDPEAGTWLSGATYIVHGTAADVGTAGIAKVYYKDDVRTAEEPEVPATPGIPALWSANGWSEASNTAAWTASIPLTVQGERRLFLRAVDKAGNVSDAAVFEYGVDQHNPTIAYSSPAGTYVNGAFTLTGTANDTNAVTSVRVEEKRPGDAEYRAAVNAAYDPDTNVWQLPIDPELYPVGEYPDGDYAYRIIVTDAAGKHASTEKTLRLDMTNPTIAFVDPVPYIVEEGTVYGNGTMTVSGSVSDANGIQSLEMKIGTADWDGMIATAPYTSFTKTFDTTDYAAYGHTDDSDLVIQVRAVDKAGNELISSYTLRIDQDTDKPKVLVTAPIAGSVVSNAVITLSGSVTDDDGVEQAGSIQYRLSADGGATWDPDWTAVPANKIGGDSTLRLINSHTFTSIIDGTKLLQVRAVDIYGAMSDTTAVTFTQDTGAPELSGLPDTSAPRNGDFSVSGTATDTNGTVKAVRYRVLKNGGQIIGWTNATLDDEEVSTTGFSTGVIPTTDNEYATYQVVLESEDEAGNKRQESLTFIVDRIDPVPSFGFPTAGAVTNNVIQISGTASDGGSGTGIQSVSLRIVKDDIETSLPGVIGTTSWYLPEFDTALYGTAEYANDLGGVFEITLRVTAADTAGNVGYTDRVFRIDQATDIPVITFTTQSSPTYLSDPVVRGTVKDDDAVASVQVSVFNGGAWSGWTDADITSGAGTGNVSWSFDLGAGDGARTVRVRAADNSTPAITGTSSDTTFLIDRESPDAAFTSPAADNPKLKAGEFGFGGTIADESPIASVRLKIDSADFTTGTVYDADFWNDNSWSHTFAPGELPDGVRTVYLRVTDAAGRAVTINKIVTVDTTGPVVSVIEPESEASVYGKIKIRGTAEDATSGVKNVKIGLGRTIDTSDWENAANTWQPATGTVSWEYTFLNISNFANPTYAYNIGDTDEDDVEDVGETWITNVWKLYIYVRAEDSSGLSGTGNVSYIETYRVEIDPNRDRPEVTILQPDNDATAGGFLRIFGTAVDAQSIEKVQIAFDMNNDGDFSDAEDTWPGKGAGNESDASTTAWYTVNGTNNWYQVVNDLGEFNPDTVNPIAVSGIRAGQRYKIESLGTTDFTEFGAAESTAGIIFLASRDGTAGDGNGTVIQMTRTVKFKVRAWDFKTVPGDGIPGIEVVQTVTFDKTIPQYETLSLESGDTIGGQVVLTGYVRDESGITSILFNHEGPRISTTELIGKTGAVPKATLVNAGEDGYRDGYQTYRIEVPIDTTAADLFLNKAGSMTVSLTAFDTSGFQSIQTISLSVDNIMPSNLAYTGAQQVLDSVSGKTELKGTVRDTGVVSGIKRVVLYLTRGENMFKLKNTSDAANTGDAIDNEALGSEYSAGAGIEDYRIVIDKQLEEGDDTNALRGDSDGYPEWLTLSAGAYNWSALFKTDGVIRDGGYTLNMVAEDFAGNIVTQTRNIFIANNRPVLDSIALYTDLNGDNDADDPGEAREVMTTGFHASNYTIRNYYLKLSVGTSGGNGTMWYSMRYATQIPATEMIPGSTYTIASNGTTVFTNFGADSNEIGTVFTATGPGAGSGTVLVGQRSGWPEKNGTLTNGTLILNGSSDFAGMADTTGSNRGAFLIKVYDSTTSNDADETDELSDTVVVGFNIGNVDDVKPTARLNQLTATDIKTDGGVKLGHIEPWNHSPFDNRDAGFGKTNQVFGNDADVSGTILISGSAHDNQRLQALYLWIDLNGNGVVDAGERQQVAEEDPDSHLLRAGTNTLGTWSAKPGEQTIGEIDGHTVEWTFEWDSSKVSGVARTNVRIEVSAEDYGNGTVPNSSDQYPAGGIDDNTDLAGGFSIMKVDVVPYIMSLARSTDYNTLRSRQGRYVVRRTEQLTFRGFNLFDTTADSSIGIGGSSQNVPAGATKTEFTVTVPASARSGAVLLTVNGIESINNKNNNTRDWNKESVAGDDDTSLWTDDRFVHIWQSDDTQTGANRGYFTGSADPEHPSMTINGSGVLYGSWSNYAAARAYYGPNNGGATVILTSLDPPEHTDIHFGARLAVAYNANAYTSQWNSQYSGGVQIWDERAPASNDFNTTGNFYQLEGLYHDQKLMQFINERVVSDGDSIHVTYFDTDTKALKYTYQLSGSTAAEIFHWINLDGGYDANDEGNGVTTNVNGSGGTTRTVSEVYAAVGDMVSTGQQLLRQSNGTIVTASASGRVDFILAIGANVRDNIVAARITNIDRIVDKDGETRSASAGEFSAIDLTPVHKYPVVAYYDVANRTVKIARARAVNPNPAQWSLQTVLDPDDPNYNFSGRYISMKIDTQGYVHLAFYRNSTGDLIYMKSTNNPTDGATPYTFGRSVIIDSTGSVGIWADLTLKDNRPYISYIDSSYTNSFDGLKMAYYDPALETEAGDTAGEPDTPDGWEYMNVALNYEVESVRTSIENDTGTNFWGTAIGYSSVDYFRIAYYVDE